MVKKATENTDKSKSENQVNTDITEQFASNLSTFMETHDLSGKQLAEDAECAESYISGLKNAKMPPSLYFLLKMKKKYGISIDDFLTKDITPADYDSPPATSKLEKEELNDYAKFVGTYYLYYFDTSAYKGHNIDSPAEALRFGLLHIYANDSSIDKLSHSVVCITGIETRGEAISIRSRIEDAVKEDKETTVAGFIQSNFADSAYYGDFDMSSHHAFISMRHSNKDLALMILHRTGAKQDHYKSGIGTINSISRGREAMPTIQFIGLSRENTSLSDEELHQMLLLDHITISDSSETNCLLERIKKLYLSSEDNLTDFQRDVAVKSEISAYVRKVVEWNLFRVAKVSNRDDDSWYHKLKGTFLGEENK